jgi:hypothetical protein
MAASMCPSSRKPLGRFAGQRLLQNPREFPIKTNGAARLATRKRRRFMRERYSITTVAT